MREKAGYPTYFKEHIRESLLSFALLFIIYAKHAFSTEFYIDSEWLINHNNTTYNWMETGQFTIPLLRRILGLGVYNSYLEATVFLIMLMLVCSLFNYLMETAAGGFKCKAAGYAPLLFLVSFHYMEIFSFLYMSHAILISLALLLFADLLMLKKSKTAFAVGCICQVFAFGVYPAMTGVQLCLLCTIFLLIAYRRKMEKKQSNIFAIYMAAFFMAAFIAYVVIVKLFFSRPELINDMISWGNRSTAETVKDLLYYSVRVLLGYGMHYSFAYPLGIILIVIALIVLIKKKEMKAGMIPTCVILAVSPLLLLIVTGAAPAAKMQLTLPVCCVCMICVGVQILADKVVSFEKGSMSRVMTGLVFLILYLQSSTVLRMYYTESVIREHDKMTAIQIMTKINDIDRNKPVVFVGYLSPGYNASTYHFSESGSYMNLSVFALRAGQGGSSDYLNSEGILEYLSTLGFDYRRPSEAMAFNAANKALLMPCWPSAGSVRNMGDYILVRLSEGRSDEEFFRQ